MGLPAEKARRATYADLEAVPPNNVAEIINGVLHVFPRPSVPHARASSRLGIKLGGPFDLGEGGPGGWRILDEPELRLGPVGEEDTLVPDLAGWRVERTPRLPNTAQITLPPDWVCEVLSRRTEPVDRTEKMPIYAREGVRHLWLIHPLRRTLEAYALDIKGRWTVLAMHRGSKRVRVDPFAELELDLSLLWPSEDEPVDPAIDDEDDGDPPAAPSLSKPKGAPAKARKRPRK